MLNTSNRSSYWPKDARFFTLNYRSLFVKSFPYRVDRLINFWSGVDSDEIAFFGDAPASYQRQIMKPLEKVRSINC